MAVLFRRGPSKHVQLLRWDTSTDTFEPGQWFHGRIYERSSALSPDGRLLVYFAADYSKRYEIGKSTWVAVSRPPFLTALDIWFPHADTYGRLFLSNREHGIIEWLRRTDLADGSPNLPIQVSDMPQMGIERAREQRDGWLSLTEMESTEPDMSSLVPPSDAIPGTPAWLEWWNSPTRKVAWEMIDRGYVTHVPRVLERANDPLRLRRTERYQRYTLLRDYAVEGVDLDLSGADWADWDQQGRLVFTRAGKVFAVDLRGKGEPRPVELIDLNGNTFARVKAPLWAHEW